LFLFILIDRKKQPMLDQQKQKKQLMKLLRGCCGWIIFWDSFTIYM